jgi:excisionase family DNA binding protein
MQENGNNTIVAPIEEATSYISVDEMAKLLSIARITAYQLTKTQGFPCFYIGKRIIIPLRSLHRWAEEQASKQNVLFSKGSE